MERMHKCPDCRCYLTGDNHDVANDSELCDYCLRDRVLAGEVVRGPTWTDNAGKVRHSFYVVCSRCEGTGQVILTTTQPDTRCWSCGGTGWIDRNREEVQRAARWSGTFQGNRQPRVRELWGFVDSRTGQRVSVTTTYTKEQAERQLRGWWERDRRGGRSDVHDVLPYIQVVRIW